MANDLPDIISAIQAKVGALTGIKAAPVDPTESMNQFPFSICFPKNGTYYGQSAGWMKEMHTIVLELHFNRSILSTAVALSLPYGRRVANAIRSDIKLAGTVDATNDVRYSWGRLDWEGQTAAHIGWQFEIDVKVQPNLT